MWYLSSSIKDQTIIPSIGRSSLNHWTIREVPLAGDFSGFFQRLQAKNIFKYLLEKYHLWICQAHPSEKLPYLLLIYFWFFLSSKIHERSRSMVDKLKATNMRESRDEMTIFWKHFSLQEPMEMIKLEC